MFCTVAIFCCMHGISSTIFSEGRNKWVKCNQEKSKWNILANAQNISRTSCSKGVEREGKLIYRLQLFISPYFRIARLLNAKKENNSVEKRVNKHLMARVNKVG